ncbi:N-terminal glutamine amidase-domain-containing protein [Mycena rosella]|uniref:Protein N-terminal glutamine amidohydrolase n=1 Tax=Mycena rosella TaxID=1033263 RepID=A0AAD7GM45_MYCRO|nr:N-terminal glutamine amidase-domain-containing protein [Mycena rosella]
MLDPPVLPETIHTPFYCEENVFLLGEAFLSCGQEVFAVFISNEFKTVVLWNQKQSKDPQSVVVWDYHVVLWLRTSDGQNWIYDSDSRLPVPSLMKDYLHDTFREGVPRSYQSLFRVVPGRIYLENFASDRSHMHASTSLPPCYAPLRGSASAVANNLMRSFVSMVPSEETFGNVYDLSRMLRMAEA